MPLVPECPACPTPLDPSTPVCPVHGEVAPLWRAGRPSYDDFAEHLRRAAGLPTLLPWPVPAGLAVTDFGTVESRAAFVTCGGELEPDGHVEVTALVEEPGTGLGARCAGTVGSDPGAAVDGPVTTRLDVDGREAALWPVEVTGMPGDPLDRAVLAGEAGGRWLWLVVRPAPAVLLLPDLPSLVDVSGLGPALLVLPFAAAPRSW